MLTATTDKDYARYMRNRQTELPLAIERICRLYSLPSVSFNTSDHEPHSCRFTRDGVVLRINPRTLLAVASRPGIDVLPLAIADLFTITHMVWRARDGLDPSFFIPLAVEQPTRGFAWWQDTYEVTRDASRTYFETTVNDLVIDHRLLRLPLLERYSRAYASRLLERDMSQLPLHIQLMKGLHLAALGALDTNCAMHNRVEGILTDLISPPAHDIVSDLADKDVDYGSRQRLAYKKIFPLFQELLDYDSRYRDPWALQMLYEDESPYGKSEHSKISEFSDPTDDDDLPENLLGANAPDTLANSALSFIKDVEGLRESESDDDAPGLILPRTGEPTDELEIVDDTSEGYFACVARHRRVIDRVGDLLLRLATPTQSVNVPRYGHIAATQGVRLNPNRLVKAQMQLLTGSRQAIWQPLVMQCRHQEMQFAGLDIFLLLDCSGSMGGSNAEFATATGVCLIEGLQLARYRASLDQRSSVVDVRVQLLAFGSGWAELTPLCREPNQAQKELAYFNLMHPSSNFTFINGALKCVRSNALANPQRDVLCLVISDGLFSDNQIALQTVQSMPKRVYIGHINIGDVYGGMPITLHNETVSDPRVLPERLRAILDEYFAMIAARSG